MIFRYHYALPFSTSKPVGSSLERESYDLQSNKLGQIISLWPAFTQKSRGKIRVIFLGLMTDFGKKGFWFLWHALRKRDSSFYGYPRGRMGLRDWQLGEGQRKTFASDAFILGHCFLSLSIVIYVWQVCSISAAGNILSKHLPSVFSSNQAVGDNVEVY